MGWRGTLVGACVVGLLTPGLALAKQRRDWVDPPLDLPVAASPPPAASVEPDADAGQEDAALTAAVPEVVAAADPPQVIRAGSKSSAGCTLRTYTVAPGATVRVHAC